MKKDAKVSEAKEVINLLESKKTNNVQKNFIEALKQSVDNSKHKIEKNSE